MTSEPGIRGDSQFAEPDAAGLGTCSSLKGTLEVCEHERLALEGMGDPQMQGVLLAISRLQAEIVVRLRLLARRPAHRDEVDVVVIAALALAPAAGLALYASSLTKHG